jgi:hypothetical protein
MLSDWPELDQPGLIGTRTEVIKTRLIPFIKIPIAGALAGSRMFIKRSG